MRATRAALRTRRDRRRIARSAPPDPLAPVAAVAAKNAAACVSLDNAKKHARLARTKHHCAALFAKP